MNKVDIAKVCEKFNKEVYNINHYLDQCKLKFKDEKLFLSYCHEYAIISLYKHFEQFMLRLIIGCLNHDHTIIEEKYNVYFGEHINDDICEFIVTRGGYFNFSNQDDLIGIINKNIGKSHAITEIISNPKYKDTIKRLCIFRNYSAHNSRQSKAAVKKTIGVKNIGNAGSWLKTQGRFNEISSSLEAMSNEMRNCASN